MATDKTNLLSLLRNAEVSIRQTHLRHTQLYGTRNEHGHTYLHLALEYEPCRPYVGMLFEELFGCYDAESHTWDTGLTPYHLAVQNGCLETMSRFSWSLWCGADWVQVLDFKDGNTPLALAAAEGNYSAVCEILNICTERRSFLKGSDIDHTNSSGKTALNLATDNHHNDIVKLIEGKRKDLGNDKSDIAAIYSDRVALYKDMRMFVEESNHHQFRRLAQNFTLTTCTTEDGKFLKEIFGELLHRKYPRKSLYQMVMDVLDAASRCEFKDFLRHKYEKGKTALLLAGEYGHMSLVRLLLTRGANIDDEDQHKRKVLHMAAGFGDQDTVRFIIDMKGYRLFEQFRKFITHKSNDGKTTRDRLFKLFRKFIAHKDNDGKTALHYVAQSGDSDRCTAEFLCRPWSAGLVKEDNNGCTPLHYAVRLFIDKYEKEEGHWDFNNYQIETIYDVSPVKEQLKLFTDREVRYKLVNCIFDGDGPKAKEWYIISAFKLIRLRHLSHPPAIRQATLEATLDTEEFRRAFSRHGLHKGGQFVPDTVKGGIVFRFEPNTARSDKAVIGEQF
jgi:ankyrin repeat protein